MKRISSSLSSVKYLTLMSGMIFALTASASSEYKGYDVVPGEVIVKFKNSKRFFKEKSVYSALNALGSEALVNVQDFTTDAELQLIKVSNSKRLGEVLQRLAAEEEIEYAEPNYVVRIADQNEAGVPNDADFEKLWGIHNKGQPDPKGQVGIPGVDINVLPAWAKGWTGSREVKVAVIDTGIDYNHPDLKNNILINAAEIPGDGIDNDGNGFVDDVYGWNFVTLPGNNDPLDDHNHGTHCAGTIGAEGNNEVGVAGVNWKVSMMPVKFLSASGGGSSAGAIESIKYATKRGVHIMSNSWGGGGFSQAMMDSIKEAKDQGILFVAAAGNNGTNNDSKPHYPSNYQVENVVSVAAIDNQDKLASFSCFGSKTVHVAAPGVNVYSTTTRGAPYQSFSGTSMATPHVAGVAALLLSIQSDLSYVDLKDRLIGTSVPVRGLKKKVVANGRVNVWNAINNVRAPEEPKPDPSQWKFVENKIESPHPYENNRVYKYSIEHPGAKFIRVRFSMIDTETRYDVIRIRDGNGEMVEEISGKQSAYVSEYAAGGKVEIVLTSDSSNNGQGFIIDGIDVIE